MGLNSLSPGPGTYTHKVKAFEIEKPRFHMGVKVRDLKGNTTVPGAGNYDPSINYSRKNMPSYSMKIKLGSSLTNT